MSHFSLPEPSRVPLVSSLLAWGKAVVRIWGLLLLMTLLLFSAAPDVALANDPAGDGLFADAGIATDGLTDDPTVMRGRFVNINFSQLSAKDGSPHNGFGEQLLLNPFEDTRFTAVLDKVQANPSGSYIWEGHLADVSHDQTQVTLVVKDGIMVGKIAMPTAIYEIQYVGGDLHKIVQINQAAFPHDENDAIPVGEEELATVERRQPSSLSSTSDDGSVIDVLVLYTPDSKIGAGGTTAAIESTIELAVAETNQAYQNSEVNQRLFLTHMAEVDYIEAGSSTTDLSHLRSPSDGVMDHVHALRDEYHADAVVLIVENAGGFCGVAYLMSLPTTSFDASAFSVVARECATGNYTFGHELGHNMGLNHDWYVNTRTTPYPHSHGYVNDDINAPWRTMMAYNSKCRDQGFYCPRLPYLSNPNVTRNEAAMGVATGTSTDCDTYNPENPPCDADNHLALNNTAATVDQFRISETVWQGHNSNWNDATNWSRGIVPRLIDDVTIPSTPTGGYFPTISDTITIRDLTILDHATLTMTGGTLTLLGNWQEEGTGTFQATDGTVLFNGYLDQTIQTTSESYFHHLQIGDGSGTQKVQLNNDIDIEGNLSLMQRASFKLENHTIYLAGNWSDDNSAFEPDLGTLVLDGTTQIVRKRTQDSESWDGVLTFHNLSVNSKRSGTIKGDIIVTNDLTINAGGLLNIATHHIAVEGTVTNHGGLEQSQTVNDATTEFLTIKNAAQSETKYYGVQITPDGGAGLGSTSVRILGNQNCTTNPTDPIIQRCFKITPTIPNSATIRYWFTEAERNGVDADSIQIWNWKRNKKWFIFEEKANAHYGSFDHCAAGVDANCWYEWNGINNYSPMSSGSTAAPTGNPTTTFAGPLATFAAAVGADDVDLTWQILSESNHIGFNLYRRTLDSQLSESVLLNSEPIMAQAADNEQNLSYEWKDRNLEEGVTYLYWLDEIDINGTVIRHGPINITISAPTSVHLDSLQAATTVPSKKGLLILSVLALMILIWATVSQKK